MKSELAKEYLSKKRTFFEKAIQNSENEVKKLETEKQALQKLIEEEDGKIDEAYEIFAPNPSKNTKIKKHIEELKQKIKEQDDKIQIHKEKTAIYEKEMKILNEIFSENNSKSTSEEFSEENKTRQEERKKQDTKKDSTEKADAEKNTGNKSSAETQIVEKDVKIISLSKREQSTETCILDKTFIENLVYRCENLQRFFDLDKERCRVEVANIIKILNGLLK